MRLPKLLLIMAFCLLWGYTDAQQKKSPLSGKFRTNHFSRSQKRIACPIFEDSQYPYQGVGFKLGDPFALTYKFYPNKHWAFALDAGRAASGLYNKYYRTRFADYIPDSISAPRSFNYLAHKAETDWFLELKFLYQWDASAISPGLQFYMGAGWQWRNTAIRYDYLYEDGLFETRLNNFKQRRITYGPTGVVGFEYSYFSLPLSAFIEIEYFMDVLIDPGYTRFQGGVGLRYVF